jgi:hypothetical protein
MTTSSSSLSEAICEKPFNGFFTKNEQISWLAHYLKTGDFLPDAVGILGLVSVFELVSLLIFISFK